LADVNGILKVPAEKLTIRLKGAKNFGDFLEVTLFFGRKIRLGGNQQPKRSQQGAEHRSTEHAIANTRCNRASGIFAGVLQTYPPTNG
jgi:hypothetical protein